MFAVCEDILHVRVLYVVMYFKLNNIHQLLKVKFSNLPDIVFSILNQTTIRRIQLSL